MATAWKLVIAAGGTGGHISPALAIADYITKLDPACHVEFLCGSRAVELEIYRKAGVTPTTLGIERLRSGWLGWVANIFTLRRALKIARAYLQTCRPQVVLGMGGYVCVPVVMAAAMQKIPTMVHEQNAMAGRANRWLSRRVNLIACAYPQAARSFPATKTRVTGNPVRPEFVGGDRQTALRRWELTPDAPVLLVVGGSQGARRLNQLVLSALEDVDRQRANSGGLQVLWSCGEPNVGDIRERLGRMALQKTVVRVVPFIQEMGLAYAAADLALSRAGAMALAELMANHVPAILVPLPEAVANHQWLNAQPLAEAGAAVPLAESDLDASRLAEHVGGLLADPSARARMREAAQQLGQPDALGQITAMIRELRGELP